VISFNSDEQKLLTIKTHYITHLHADTAWKIAELVVKIRLVKYYDEFICKWYNNLPTWKSKKQLIGMSYIMYQ